MRHAPSRHHGSQRAGSVSQWVLYLLQRGDGDDSYCVLARGLSKVYVVSWVYVGPIAHGVDFRDSHHRSECRPIFHVYGNLPTVDVGAGPMVKLCGGVWLNWLLTLEGLEFYEVRERAHHSLTVPVLVSTCITTAIAIATVIVMRHGVDAGAVYRAAMSLALYMAYTHYTAWWMH